MRVALLGPVSAESGNLELGLGGLKQRAVFALLALNAGRVVSLDRLVDELWPAEPPSRATLNLQSYVSRLRRVLAAAARTDPDAPQLVTRPPGWLLDLDPASVDVTRFEDLIARARTARPADALDLLREADGLWRGEPLADLQSVPFAREEGARLTELRRAAQESMFEAALAVGDAQAVVAEGARFVAANPLRERGRRALALAFYLTGRQSEALALLASLRRTLAEELGLDPSPETQTLEAAILRHDPRLAPGPATTAPAAAAPPEDGSPRPDAVEAPGEGEQRLLGRTAALAAVDGALAAARSGRGAVLVLEAPAGAGKTALLDAVAHRVAAAGGHAVHGSGAAAGAMPALWPWVSIVRRVAAMLTDDDPLWSAEGAAGHALSVMRAGDPGGVEASGSSARSRTGLYRGIVDLLLAARARGPLAVVLDDAQWVDADSLDLLALAVDELVEHAVVVAVAVRTGEPGTDDVARTLRRLRRDTLVRVPLPGLGVDDVAALIGALSDRPADAEVAAAIHARTLGNPFFAGELVRLLASEQRLTPAAVREALPEEVEEVLRRRLDRLPQQTVALLTVAALAGGPADVDTLATVTGLDADAVLDACESALLAELLVEDGAGFVLRHDLIRQTLEHAVSGARRVRLHARLADALRARPSLTAQDVVTVARHLTFAEPVVGPAAPVPYLIAAADDALTRNAHREAERLLEQGLDLASRVADREQRATLTSTLRNRLLIVGTWSRGLPSGPGAADGSDHRPDVTENPTAWVNGLVTRGVSGHYADVADVAESALAAELPPAPRAAAHFVAGWAHFMGGRLEDAERHLRAFEDLDDGTRDVGWPALGAALDVGAAGFAALVAHCRGDEPAADRAHRLARARAVGRDETTTMAGDLYSALLAAMRGHAEVCRAYAAACRARADQLGLPLIAAEAALLAGWADAVLGDRTGAGRADEAYARREAAGVLMFAPLHLLLRAEAHAVAGRLERAADLVAEAAARSAGLGDVCRAPRLVALAAELTPIETRSP